MKQIDMRDGPIGTKIVQFSIPLFLTYLIQLLYHTTDTLIAGRFLGTDPQAAVGAAANALLYQLSYTSEALQKLLAKYIIICYTESVFA